MAKKIKYFISAFVFIGLLLYSVIFSTKNITEAQFQVNQRIVAESLSLGPEAFKIKKVGEDTAVVQDRDGSVVMRFFHSTTEEGVDILALKIQDSLEVDTINAPSGTLTLQSNGTAEMVISSTYITIGSNSVSLSAGDLAVGGSATISTDLTVSGESTFDSLASFSQYGLKIPFFTHITDTAGLGSYGDNILFVAGDSVGITTSGGASYADTVRWIMGANGNSLN